LTPGTEHKIPGEPQADIPLEVGQQHPDSHGGTNGKSKNNANKGERSVLWSLANDNVGHSCALLSITGMLGRLEP